MGIYGIWYIQCQKTLAKIQFGILYLNKDNCVGILELPDEQSTNALLRIQYFTIKNQTITINDCNILGLLFNFLFLLF